MVFLHMKFRMSALVLRGGLFVAAAVGWAAVATAQEAPSLNSHIDSGIAAVRITGTGGGFYGPCMELTVTNNGDETITFVVRRGQVFVPQSSDFQQMVISKALDGYLDPRSTQTYQVNAFCMNAYLDPPNASSTYDLSVNDAAQTVLDVLRVIDEKGYHSAEGAQTAVWTANEGRTQSDLESHFNASLLDSTVGLARSILYDAGHASLAENYRDPAAATSVPSDTTTGGDESATSGTTGSFEDPDIPPPDTPDLTVFYILGGLCCLGVPAVIGLVIFAIVKSKKPSPPTPPNSPYGPPDGDATLRDDFRR